MTSEAQACSWKTLLEDYKAHGKQKTPKAQEEETTKLFMDIINEDNKAHENEKIPRFFFKKPTNFSDIYLSVRSEAKQKFLILKSYDLPQKKNLKDLWLELRENISPPQDDTVKTERINYKDFRKVADKSPLFADYFKASTFLKFDKDKYGRIEILSFFHYVVRKNSIEENKINLSLNDICCEGFLIDKDLENYIKDEIKQFYFYKEITDDIMEFYLLVAQRKFFFFLDPKRTGKIYINDIVTSNILTEFLELKNKNSPTQQMENSANWFSLTNFWRIYKKYIDLDKDQNGMLSKEELIKFGPGLTSIFIDRIFEEYQKYNAFDFKQFIDFVLALENRKHPSSIQYIWKAIDLYHKNAVDTFIINMFYRQVVKKLINRDKGEYKIDDIKDEIWDMIKPKNPNYITLQDVLASPYSDTVLSLLIDARSFYLHDQKENLVVEEFVELEEEY